MKLDTFFLMVLSGTNHLVSAGTTTSHDTSNDASTLLNNVIESIGGMSALKEVQRLVYTAKG